MTRTEKLAKQCHCIDKINKAMSAVNGMLYRPLMIQFETGRTGLSTRVAVMTEQVETGRGKKKAPTVFATFCPFCGVKYPEES